WMAKTGATGLLFIRAAHDAQWVIPELLPALEERGLEVEGGGHVVGELMPRELFAIHPEYFPALRDGARSVLVNVCTAGAEARGMVRARTRGAAGAIGGTGAFHLWGLDLFGGGWCACATCRARPPSDQALLLCNAAAGGLGDRPLFHLAYHDT